jgi:hypothetical protein
MRERRKIISLDTDSALALMQEIYNDIVEQKNTAAFMKDAEDMSVIGPVIKDQQKILVDCLAKKQTLVKLQIDLLKQQGASVPGQKGFTKMELTEADRAMLEKLVEDNDDKEENDSDKYQT